MSNSMVEEYWSRFPDAYDKNQEYVVGKQLLDDITQELNRLPELGRLLEFGCGTGNFTKIVIAKAKSMVATDLSDSLLEVARTSIGDNPKITIQKEDCVTTSFPPASFDSVFMANLIHVIENPGALLQESYRILKDNGTIVIVTFTSHSMKLWEKVKLAFRFYKVWGKPPAHTHTFSPESLARMMEEGGFTVETSRIIGSKTKSLYIIGRKASINKQ